MQLIGETCMLTVSKSACNLKKGERKISYTCLFPKKKKPICIQLSKYRSFRTGNEWRHNSHSFVDWYWQHRHGHAVYLICWKGRMKGLVHDRKHHCLCTCLRLNHYHYTGTVRAAILSVVKLYLMTLSRCGPEFWLDGLLLAGGKSRMLSVWAPRSGVKGRRAGLTSLSCMSHFMHTTAPHTHINTFVYFCAYIHILYFLKSFKK